jgi:hypothetical protein
VRGQATVDGVDDERARPKGKEGGDLRGH